MIRSSGLRSAQPIAGGSASTSASSLRRLFSLEQKNATKGFFSDTDGAGEDLLVVFPVGACSGPANAPPYALFPRAAPALPPEVGGPKSSRKPTADEVLRRLEDRLSALEGLPVANQQPRGRSARRGGSAGPRRASGGNRIQDGGRNTPVSQPKRPNSRQTRSGSAGKRSQDGGTPPAVQPRRPAAKPATKPSTKPAQKVAHAAPTNESKTLFAWPAKGLRHPVWPQVPRPATDQTLVRGRVVEVLTIPRTRTLARMKALVDCAAEEWHTTLQAWFAAMLRLHADALTGTAAFAYRISLLRSTGTNFTQFL
jgi:hypothetical protein